MLLVLACSPRPIPPPGDGGVEMCMVTAPTECTRPELSYADIKPVIDRHCRTCHYGAVDGPWPLTTWQDLADWQDTVRDDIVGCVMPPPDAGSAITNEERMLVLDWLRCGYPR